MFIKRPPISRLEKKLLHYTGEAIAHYHMLQHGDRLLVCLSGGKDSFGLLQLVKQLQMKAKIDFHLHVLAIDKGFPTWNGAAIAAWLATHGYEFTILPSNIAQVVNIKQQANRSPCILCSRLRRGHIYTFAQQNNYNKIALGHHREDLITSLLMSIFYNGKISSMPPKLLAENKKMVVIRPLIYCQEEDLANYAQEQAFPVSPPNVCPLKANNTREQISLLIRQLALTNRKIPSNMLHALRCVTPSHLMDKQLWDFANLEAQGPLPPHDTNDLDTH